MLVSAGTKLYLAKIEVCPMSTVYTIYGCNYFFVVAFLLLQGVYMSCAQQRTDNLRPSKYKLSILCVS